MCMFFFGNGAFVKFLKFKGGRKRERERWEIKVK